MAQEIVEAPIVGKVVGVGVKLGDVVAEGDTICEIESMKMVNPILAPIGGKIIELKASVGDVIQTGSLIAIIEY